MGKEDIDVVGTSNHVTYTLHEPSRDYPKVLRRFSEHHLRLIPRLYILKPTVPQPEPPQWLRKVRIPISLRGLSGWMRYSRTLPAMRPTDEGHRTDITFFHS